MNDFYQSKVIWVTGASSGIGKAICKVLDVYGVKFVLSARSEDQLYILASELTSESLVVPLDLSVSDNYDSLVDCVIAQYGRIDILINNGGISQRSNVSDTATEVERRIMEVNYFGNIALSKAVLPVFQKQQSGHYAIMSSIAGKFGFFQRSSYSASKHALHGYYESLRLEEEKNGIKVSLICPGKINTPISVNALKGTGEEHGKIDKNQKEGMNVESCARRIVQDLSRKKMEILVGGKEIKSVKVKRFFPGLFYKIIRKQDPTG